METEPDFRTNAVITEAIKKLADKKSPKPWKYETMVTAVWNSILLTYFPINKPYTPTSRFYLAHEYYQDGGKADICLLLDVPSIQKTVPVILVECKKQAAQDSFRWDEAVEQLRKHFKHIYGTYLDGETEYGPEVFGAVACGTNVLFYIFEDNFDMTELGVDELRMKVADINDEKGQADIHELLRSYIGIMMSDAEKLLEHPEETTKQ